MSIFGNKQEIIKSIDLFKGMIEQENINDDCSTNIIWNVDDSFREQFIYTDLKNQQYRLINILFTIKSIHPFVRESVDGRFISNFYKPEIELMVTATYEMIYTDGRHISRTDQYRCLESIPYDCFYPGSIWENLYTNKEKLRSMIVNNIIKDFKQDWINAFRCIVYKNNKFFKKSLNKALTDIDYNKFLYEYIQ